MLVYVIGDQEDRTEGYPASLTARLNEIDVNVGITGVRLTGTGTWAERAAMAWARQRHKKIQSDGRPQAVVVVRVPECIRGQKTVSCNQLQRETAQVWKDAVRGQTKGLLERFKAIFETHWVIWIHNPGAADPDGAGGAGE